MTWQLKRLSSALSGRGDLAQRAVDEALADGWIPFTVNDGWIWFRRLDAVPEPEAPAPVQGVATPRGSPAEMILLDWLLSQQKLLLTHHQTISGCLRTGRPCGVNCPCSTHTERLVKVLTEGSTP